MKRDRPEAERDVQMPAARPPDHHCSLREGRLPVEGLHVAPGRRFDGNRVLGNPLPADKRGQRLRTLLVELYERWHAENLTGGYDAKAAEWKGKAAPLS